MWMTYDIACMHPCGMHADNMGGQKVACMCLGPPPPLMTVSISMYSSAETLAPTSSSANIVVPSDAIIHPKKSSVVTRSRKSQQHVRVMINVQCNVTIPNSMGPTSIWIWNAVQWTLTYPNFNPCSVMQSKCRMVNNSIKFIVNISFSCSYNQKFRYDVFGYMRAHCTVDGWCPFKLVIMWPGSQGGGGKSMYIRGMKSSCLRGGVCGYQGLRCCVQVAVYSSRRGFESHFWHTFFLLSLWIQMKNCTSKWP